MPQQDPMKTCANLMNVPHIFATLIDKFKGELETRHHRLALASKMLFRIKLHHWRPMLPRKATSWAQPLEIEMAQLDSYWTMMDSCITSLEKSRLPSP